MEKSTEKPAVSTTKEHRGVTISLREDFLFSICLEGSERAFKSYGEAVAAIDDHFKRKESMERKRLSLEAIVSDGTRVTITGVHARNADILTAPKAGEYTVLYPDHPWIEAKIKRILALEAEIRLLKQSLKPCVIPKPSRGYGNFDPSAHAAMVDKLEKDYSHAFLTAAELFKELT